MDSKKGCPTCGASLPVDNEFCPFCGADLRTVAARLRDGEPRTTNLKAELFMVGGVLLAIMCGAGTFGLGMSSTPARGHDLEMIIQIVFFGALSALFVGLGFAMRFGKTKGWIMAAILAGFTLIAFKALNDAGGAPARSAAPTNLPQSKAP